LTRLGKVYAAVGAAGRAETVSSSSHQPRLTRSPNLGPHPAGSRTTVSRNHTLSHLGLAGEWVVRGWRKNMADPAAERERRIRQFEHYLGLMEQRTRRLVKANCFVIFSGRLPARLRHRITAGERFVQFSFQADHFFMDLPDTTLTPEEANGIVATRPGFRFALAEGAQKLGDVDRRFDPIQRIYQYGEQRLAAEETASIFFDLWEFRLGAWFTVEAQTFRGNRRWERGFALG
jgi:hypothetical protein